MSVRESLYVLVRQFCMCRLGSHFMRRLWSQFYVLVRESFMCQLRSQLIYYWLDSSLCVG